MAAKKKAPARKQARRTRVARAIVEGKSVSQIARDERVSRATASADANSTEVQLLITSLVEAERGMIRTLFQKGLAAVEDSFTATRVAVFEGAKVDCGPDHYARLTGVKCLTALLTAGRQAVRPEPPAKKTISLEDLGRLAAAPGSLAN